MKKKNRFAKAESNCLNCGQPLSGVFCSACGQQGHLPKDNFLHLLAHFLADYFHYDGKFIHTIKALFAQPGKITCEYTAGKRRKYLNPIQLYLFSSAVFFFIFIKWVMFTGGSEMAMKDIYTRYPIVKAKQDSVFLHNSYKPEEISFAIDELGFLINNKVYTRRQYDSIESTLPPSRREAGLTKKFHHKLLSINDSAPVIDNINSVQYVNAILSSLPKAFFILLPVFALLLKWLFRRRPFADHIIFSLHFHSILFTLFSVVLLVFNMIDFAGFSAFGLLLLLFCISYLFLALRHYMINLSAWALTFRFALLLLAYSGILLLTIILIFVFSIFLM